jgi:hypothetical protein
MFKDEQLVALIQYNSVLAIGEYAEMKQLISEDDEIYVSGLYRETDMNVDFSIAREYAQECGFEYEFNIELWYAARDYAVNNHDEYFCDDEGRDLFTLEILR